MYSINIDKVLIKFKSRAEKENYVIEELKATRAEYIECIQAITKEQRNTAAKKLYNARIAFAKTLGYLESE